MSRAINRRRFVTAIAGGLSGAIAMPRLVRAQNFKARQYHPLPKDSHLDKYLTAIWDAVRRETGGRLDVTVLARNNDVEYGEPQILKQIISGELEFFVLNGDILSQAHPVTDIQGIPFAYASSVQVASLMDGELGAYMREELAPKGVQLIPFGAMENGFKHITSATHPIRTAADLQGFRMRIPGGKLFVDFYKALGAEPKVVNLNKLYHALVDAEVEGLENPLVMTEDLKLYEICKYVGVTSHQWAGFNMIANQAYWQGLPADIQDAIVRNAKKFVPQQRAFVQALNAGYERKLKERGMIFNAVDTASFRTKLIEANFYRDWRQTVGIKAWDMLEQTVGKVG